MTDPREPEEKTEEEMIRDAERALYEDGPIETDDDFTGDDEADLRRSLEYLLG